MSAPEPANRSGFSAVDNTSDPAAYVRRLDATGAHDFWRKVKDQALALLAVRDGARLLDLGCGTGDDARSLAHLVGSSGQVVGVDASATLIAVARERAMGLNLPVTFQRGDAHHLDFPDQSFDGCRAERVLQHLGNPSLAVAEMVRVARPGAPIVLIEPDYGTLRIGGADPQVTARILAHRHDHYSCGMIGRQLPRICKDLRLVGITVRLFSLAGTVIDGDEERYIVGKYAAAAQAAGVISAAEANVWMADLIEAGTRGSYRRALTVYLVSGRKP